ncbi:hypothetical protein [Pseudomonas sp.]|uniref:hypothetical protein n=1 Tax=Pseudomonas sp. TaxID=306 RepID=UPI0028A22CC3|nr:hypothetical protein [Pseudomonas sp.]
MSEREDFEAWLKTQALPGSTSWKLAMYAAWQARAARTAPDALQAEVERLSNALEVEKRSVKNEVKRRNQYAQESDELDAEVERLREEVERLHEERDSYQRVGIKAMEESDALREEIRKLMEGQNDG